MLGANEEASLNQSQNFKVPIEKKNYKLGQWKYVKLFSSLLNEWPMQIVSFSMSFGMNNKKINKKESDIRLACG